MVSRRALLRSGSCLLGTGMAALALPAMSPAAAQEPEAGSADPRDRIARVTAYAISAPVMVEAGDYRRETRMGGTLVEVETADGLTGHGFTSISNAEIIAAAVNLVAGPSLIGEDALSRGAVSERLHALLTPRAQTGHAQHAISAIDIALWDILGKRLDQPVWRLLGGTRALVPTYTTFGMAYMERDELALVAAHLVRQERRQRLKMVVAANLEERIGSGESIEQVLREDAARIRAVREAIGPDTELFIDANHGLDIYETRRFLNEIAEYDIAFFEEPMAGNDVRRLADLRRVSPVPIAAGQNETHIRRFRDFVVEQAVDVLQFNTCICGGYSAALQVAALGEAFATPIDNGGGYAEYNMHLHAGVPNGGLVEWHLGAVALGKVLYDRQPAFEGDRLRLPDAPGLGFAVNADALREFGMTSGL
jgi:L-alanine-DL-glutamate epimerase-like enolase superfamily enzyme